MTLQALSSSTLSFLFSVSFCFFYLFVDLAECRHIVTLRSLPEGNLYEAARTHAHPRGQCRGKRLLLQPDKSRLDRNNVSYKF